MPTDGTPVAPMYDSLRARLERFLAPSYGYCYRCGRPWNRVEGHLTNYKKGSGCFPLCEGCWSKLHPVERLPYYDALINEWIRQLPSEVVEYDRKRNLIRQAVIAGG